MSHDSHAIGPVLTRVFDGARLTTDEARGVMGRLMDGELSQMQAAALLAALRTRGETVEEIVGFAQAMRERAVRVPVRVDGPLLDTCGTGGTGVSTINVSTTATFVAAAGGVRIAKHGNRGVTKRSGSADVLEALGVRLDLGPERLAEAIEEVGMGFIFARAHHPAMRFVAPIRADLQARTIFNNLGPLTNPAGATHQLHGRVRRRLDRAAGRGARAGWASSGRWWSTATGSTTWRCRGRRASASSTPTAASRPTTVTPEDLGVAPAPLEAILGGDAGENAAVARAILAGRSGDRGATWWRSAPAPRSTSPSASPDLAAGVRAGPRAARSGAGLEVLERYAAFTRPAELPRARVPAIARQRTHAARGRVTR